MEEQNKAAVHQNESNAADSQAANHTETTQSDDARRIAELETENSRLTTERDNYKAGMLKAKGKNSSESSENTEETDDDRVRRIVREEQIDKDIAKNNAEKDSLLKKVLKENEELKLAHMNKTTVPTSTGSSTEETAQVRSTLVTKEQEDYFRNQRGWTEKDIERYKHNLRKNGAA